MQVGSVGPWNQPAALSAMEISVEEYLHQAGTVQIQVVDVREPDEWIEGRIPGSVLIPLGELTGRLSELDPNVPVVTVCRVGARSLYGAEDLLAAGFADVMSLAGGLNAWIAAGQPLEL